VNLRLGFMASHNGTNMRKIVDAIEEGSLKATANVFITNNPNSTGLVYVQNKNIPSFIVNEENHPNSTELDARIRNLLIEHDVNLVFLTGYMRKIGPLTLKTFNNRILNVHPSLLPKFGGKGMYGSKVHRAVLESKEKQSGATVHIIDEEYDHGPVLAQLSVPVFNDDSVETLTERVKECEGKLVLKVLSEISNDLLYLPD
jgi:phosphoribosylglycinamide formyltransferase-1